MAYNQEQGQNSSEDQKVNNQSGILLTKVLNIQNKRYYFDCKEHDHGRFLKLAETAQSGRKSRLVIPMYIVPEVEKIMADMNAHLEGLSEFVRKGNDEANHSDDSGRRHQGGGDGRRRGGRRHERPETEAAADLKADKIVYGRRHYYFNLKENTRGRYLRLKAIGDIPSTVGNRRRGGPRGMRGRNMNNDQQARAVIIPAAGINDFRAELTAIVKQFAVDPATDRVALADKNIAQTGAANDKLPASQRFSSKSFRKVLFIDAGENSRGTYARLTECQGHNRDAVTIPSRHFKQLGEWFMQAAEECPAEESDDAGDDGSGDAGKADQSVPNGDEQYDDGDSEAEAPVSNRRREAASDDET